MQDFSDTSVFDVFTGIHGDVVRISVDMSQHTDKFIGAIPIKPMKGICEAFRITKSLMALIYG